MRAINRMKSATPSPQAPLRMSALMMILGSQPPATGMALSGNTMNSATALGRTAPISRARNQYVRPAAFRSSGQIATPQTPPQHARDITAGTPTGAPGALPYARPGTGPGNPH